MNRAKKSAGETGNSLPPLKPQKKLLVVTAALFALWVLFLVALYFVTVWPHRHLPRVQEGGAATQPPPATAR